MEAEGSESVVRTFPPRVTASSAVNRTARISLGAFLRDRIESALGASDAPDAVHPVYYPDYIVYTTVELRRYLRSDRTVKFLVGVDAITGRVGEVDVDLPEREPRFVDPGAVLRTGLTEEEVESEWRDWIFPYVDRRYRPYKRPEFHLDEIELVHVPYWIVDYGSLDGSFAVSGLTKQVERVESMKPLKGYYENVLRSDED